jgi:hypothetical protein
MSNERERKLLPHEKPIWRKAFEASLPHMSVEGAERKAWHAVDIWKRVGAFNETIVEDQSNHPTPILATYREAWKELATTIGGCSNDKDDWESQLCSAMNDFALGKSSLDDFKHEVHLCFPDDD